MEVEDRLAVGGDLLGVGFAVIHAERAAAALSALDREFPGRKAEQVRRQSRRSRRNARSRGRPTPRVRSRVRSTPPPRPTESRASARATPLMSGWSKHGNACEARAGTNNEYRNSSLRFRASSPAVKAISTTFSPRFRNPRERRDGRAQRESRPAGRSPESTRRSPQAGQSRRSAARGPRGQGESPQCRATGSFRAGRDAQRQRIANRTDVRGPFRRQRSRNPFGGRGHGYNSRTHTLSEPPRGRNAERDRRHDNPFPRHESVRPMISRHRASAFAQGYGGRPPNRGGGG